MKLRSIHRILLIPILFVSIIIIPIDSVMAVENDHAEEQYFLRNAMNHYDTRTIECADNASQDSVLVGGDNLEKIFNFFTAKGLSNEQSAGIVGNISQESRGEPHNAQKGPDTDDPSKITGPIGGGNAWGIIQWDAGSRAIEYAKKAKIDTPIGDLSTQLELVWWHMNNETPTSAQNMIAEYKTITDVNEATRVYEKRMTGAGTPRMENRIKAANLALKSYNKDTGSATPVSTSSTNTGCDGGSGGAGLASGGMNLQQAKAFMKVYKDLAIKHAGLTPKGGNRPIKMPGENFDIYNSNCSGSGLANCSTFSEWFVGKYTKGTQAFPNGKDMVRGLLATDSGFTNGGKTPKTYAVFSRQSGGGGAGHTGVVLGVNKESGKMIIGEASCNSGINAIVAKEVSVSDFSTNDYSYAYTDGILKQGSELST